eukprot:1148257-Pelagomonas_calceolata.AAC.4
MGNMLLSAMITWQEMEDAHRGHKLFADKLNDAQALSIVDSKGEKHHLLFNYTRYATSNICNSV